MRSLLLTVALLLLPQVARANSLPPLTTWYWQIDGTVNETRVAKVYDIDMEDASADLVSRLKSKGHIVVCYFSAGTWENWRSDAPRFPASVKGAKVSGWDGENWLDIRSPIVRSLMTKRMDVAKEKGCDGLEPDNVDGYSNKPGFPLTKADQIDYDRFLADEAHKRELMVALKNATSLVKTLAPSFDFAIVEQCQQYNECAAYSPFISLGRAVLEAEYSSYSAAKCAKAKALKFSLAFYGQALNGRRYQPCP